VNLSILLAPSRLGGRSLRCSRIVTADLAGERPERRVRLRDGRTFSMERCVRPRDGHTFSFERCVRLRDGRTFSFGRCVRLRDGRTILNGEMRPSSRRAHLLIRETRPSSRWVHASRGRVHPSRSCGRVSAGGGGVRARRSSGSRRGVRPPSTSWARHRGRANPSRRGAAPLLSLCLPSEARPCRLRAGEAAEHGVGASLVDVADAEPAPGPRNEEQAASAARPGHRAREDEVERQAEPDDGEARNEQRG
jgi:hypothetical protein